jgi:hypothetical protein
MPSGGYRPGTGGPQPLSGGRRPGAGRPRKSAVAAATAAPRAEGESPLDYMLRIMRDVTVDPLRRDRMAIAAAGYLHPKAELIGKKEAAARAAREAGGEWGDDLRSPTWNTLLKQ